MAHPKMFLLCLSLACCGAPVDPTPTPVNVGPPRTSSPEAQQFTADFVERARILAPELQIRPAGSMNVEVNDHAVNLENLWAECGGVIAGCDLTYWLGAFTETSEGEFSIMLLPAAEARERNMVYRPWVEPVAQVLYIDTPHVLWIPKVNSPELQQLPAEELWKRAEANVRKQIPHTVQGRLIDPTINAHLMVGEFPNESGARLLFPEDWAPLAGPDGQLYVAAPARDLLIWTTTRDDREGLAFQWLAQAMFHGEPHPVSPAIFRWTKEGFILVTENTEPVQAGE